MKLIFSLIVIVHLSPVFSQGILNENMKAVNAFVKSNNIKELVVSYNDDSYAPSEKISVTEVYRFSENAVLAELRVFNHVYDSAYASKESQFILDTTYKGNNGITHERYKKGDKFLKKSYLFDVQNTLIFEHSNIHPFDQLSLKWLSHGYKFDDQGNLTEIFECTPTGYGEWDFDFDTLSYLRIENVNNRMNVTEWNKDYRDNYRGPREKVNELKYSTNIFDTLLHSEMIPNIVSKLYPYAMPDTLYNRVVVNSIPNQPTSYRFYRDIPKRIEAICSKNFQILPVNSTYPTIHFGTSEYNGCAHTSFMEETEGENGLIRKKSIVFDTNSVREPILISWEEFDEQKRLTKVYYKSVSCSFKISAEQIHSRPWTCIEYTYLDNTLMKEEYFAQGRAKSKSLNNPTRFKMISKRVIDYSNHSSITSESENSGSIVPSNVPYWVNLEEKSMSFTFTRFE